MPLGNTWYSGTKAYATSDSAVKITYAIGIKSSIPSFGSIEVQKVTSVAPVKNMYDEYAIIKTDDKWVVSCPGGELLVTDTGRRLIGMYPLTRSTTASSSKDAVYAPGGSTACYMLKIRKAN